LRAGALERLYAERGEQHMALPVHTNTCFDGLSSFIYMINTEFLYYLSIYLSIYTQPIKAIQNAENSRYNKNDNHLKVN